MSASFASYTAKVFKMTYGFRSDVPNNVHEVELEQPRRPAYQERRGMARLGTFEKLAYRVERAARVGAAAKLAVAVARTFVSARLCVCRVCAHRNAERAAEHLLGAAQELFH